MTNNVKGRWSIVLSGQVLQFNLSLLVISLALVVIFIASAQSADQIVRYGGTAISSLLLLAVVLGGTKYYGRQKQRPSDGGSSQLTFENQVGAKIIIANPPDCFYEQDEFRQMLRALAVGCDDTLSPDGEVVGKAADGRVKKWSAEEKKAFTEQHRRQIRGQREKAFKLLQADLLPDIVPDDKTAD